MKRPPDPPQLVERVRGMNIVRLGVQYLVVAQPLGPIDFERVRPENVPGIIVSESLHAARRAANQDNSIEGQIELSPTRKPLFTGEFVAFSEFDRVALSALVQRPGRNIRALEIGSWLGNGSTTTLVQQLQSRGGVLYCVDSWKGNPNVARHQAIVTEYDVFGTFVENVRRAAGQDIVKPLIMASSDAAAIVADRSFDLIFIDADHAYDSTRQDIELWLPKVKHGGILCGHDCEGRIEILSGDVLMRARNDDTVDGVHAGVVLAVHERWGSSVHLWAEEDVQLPNGETGRSTIWDIVA